jgi:hypothetical protein
MGIDISDWAISAEILTQSKAASATTIAPLSSSRTRCGANSPGWIGCRPPITQPPLTQLLTKSRLECQSYDILPNFQSQLALEFGETGKGICRIWSDIH